jgi:hypothetical protein
MEVTDVGNDASICDFSRRSPSPGQPRFPKYATQQGYFLTFDNHWKLHFNAPFVTVTKSVLGHSCVVTGGVARARCCYFLNYAVPIS